MVRKGFQESKVLKIFHYNMLQLHWPLFLFTIAAPFFVHSRKQPVILSGDLTGFRVTLMFFFYFITVLSILGRWLPRYTIPLRPLSYVLAAATLFAIIKMVSSF